MEMKINLKKTHSNQAQKLPDQKNKITKNPAVVEME
jgi:hypothetical protein